MRAVLESRLIQAGAQLQVIANRAEYYALAKENLNFVRGVLPTRAGTLVDELLARCP